MLPVLDCNQDTNASGSERPFTSSALGLDVCWSLTKTVHRVRFPAGAPHPRVGLLLAGHHREGSPTRRVLPPPSRTGTVPVRRRRLLETRCSARPNGLSSEVENLPLRHFKPLLADLTGPSTLCKVHKLIDRTLAV